jgi:hypothetical protein
MAYTNDDRLQVATQATSGVLTAGTFTSTSSALLRAANTHRQVLTVFNQGPGTLYVLYGEGTASTTNYSVILLPYTALELPFYQGEVRAIFSSAGTAKITEL